MWGFSIILIPSDTMVGMTYRASRARGPTGLRIEREPYVLNEGRWLRNCSGRAEAANDRGLYGTQGRYRKMEECERGRDVIARDLHLVKGSMEETRLYLVGQTRDVWIVGLGRQREAGETWARLFGIRLLWGTPGWTIRSSILRETYSE